MLSIRHALLPLLLTACATQQPAPGTAASGTAAAGSAHPGGAATATPSTAASTSTTTPPPSPYGPVRVVKSRDGKFDGEVIGAAAAGSKFSRLAIGMTMSEVTSLIGGPDDMIRHETGKRWIPFYFGGDAQRIQVLYRGAGCLTYTGGNVFGGGGDQLIRITNTQRNDCTQ